MELRYLIVIIHGYTGKTSSYSYMEKAIREKYKDATVLIPRLGLGMFSNKSPNDIVVKILDLIDQNWHEEKFDKVIIIGNSVGALIARKVYVCACGENPDIPFEDERLKEKRVWVGKVERIILLAGINRGWSMNAHLSLGVTAILYVGYLIFKVLALFNYKLFIFKVRRGSPFVTMLRLQWLSMIKNIGQKSVGNALVIQLLGTIDDLVSPDDNIDLVTGGNFYYLDMPQSGLKDYPACRFKNVVFAGSVVSTDFDWNGLIQNKRIEKVVNIVASADWVVAVFPKTFQTLRLQDLGSAGHDGFRSLPVASQLKSIKGNHGAGVSEGLWDHIADFIVTGSMPNFKSDSLVKQNGIIRFMGLISPAIFCLIIIGLTSIEWNIWRSNIDATWKVFLLITYPLVVWKVITKL